MNIQPSPALPPKFSADFPPRSRWSALLAQLPAEQVRTAAAALALEVVDITLPQSGLGLMQLNDTALNDNFYLGEIPIARAHVRVKSTDGQAGEGGAVLLDDRARLARAIAILDAVLAAQLPGWESAATLVEQGMAVHEQLMQARRALLARTHVDFSLLGQEEEGE
ncbi:MAG: phosphonate C-P lyase system protein PhnG [Rugosibacter sp.]|jgi:alpha-D-ribose 1-methylphosphonate 5-triphosphate synthase subunit PhnG|nr:alpha-D-ribose 1-methylphosphonate 5-triphosphate synthase subunit PhnG [Rugosibacter sp.]